MDLGGWDERYRTEADTTGRESEPNPVLIEIAGRLVPGRALDLACGTGRNALWLARLGWDVTAVDGSVAAIATLRRRAVEEGVTLDARVADLEKAEFTIEPDHWNLILMCYYLQKDLFEPSKRGLTPGGVMVAITLLKEPGKDSAFRLQAGELRDYFEGWEILHDREGRDAWQHAVCEIAARRPAGGVSR